MTDSPLRIIKVGGSLLEFESLAEQFNRWLAQQPPARNILLAGGGRLAAEIRDRDARFQLGEEKSHWLCIEQMSVTSRRLADLLPAAELVNSFGQLQGWLGSSAAKPPARDGSEVDASTSIGRGLRRWLDPSHPIIFDAASFLREHEPTLPGTVLPHTWQATSDSIAARLAEVLSADELVLLKSTAPPTPLTFQSAATAGYIDDHFPYAAAAIPTIRCVNLRSADLPSRHLRQEMLNHAD